MRANARPPVLAVACLGASLALSSISAAQGHPVHAGAEPTSSVRLRFPGGAPFVELPFDLVANKVLLDVNLNGTGPLRFVLDSGAPATVVLRPSRLEGVALDYYGQAHVAGAGDDAVAARPARLARGASLGLAGLQLEGVGLVVLPEVGSTSCAAGARPAGCSCSRGSRPTDRSASTMCTGSRLRSGPASLRATACWPWTGAR